MQHGQLSWDYSTNSARDAIDAAKFNQNWSKQWQCLSKASVLLAIIISPKHPSLPVTFPPFFFCCPVGRDQGRLPYFITNSRVRLYAKTIGLVAVMSR